MTKAKKELNDIKIKYETSNNKIKEISDEELKQVTGGETSNTASKYSCWAEDAATNVTVNDHITRKSDNDMFVCDGYVNAENQTLWIFHNLDDPNEKLLFAADGVNCIIHGFKR